MQQFGIYFLYFSIGVVVIMCVLTLVKLVSVLKAALPLAKDGQILSQRLLQLKEDLEYIQSHQH